MNYTVNITTIRELYQWACEHNCENVQLEVETEGRLGTIESIETDNENYIFVNCI